MAFTLIDWAFGKYFDSKVVETNCGAYKKISDYFFSNKKYDLIILGNSRAVHQYIPTVFEKKLHTSALNAGMEGTGLYYYNVLIRYYLQSHQPKLFIIDINNRELEASIVGDKYTAVKFLVPYFNVVPETKEILNLSLIERICFTSNLYRYNTKFYNIYRNSAQCFEDSDFKGYSPFYGNAKRDIRIYEDSAKPIDSERISLLSSIIEECKKKNVKLLFVFSPKQFDDRRTPSRTILNSIFKKYDLDVLDFTTDSQFKNNSLFYDAAHLNHDGATIYSKLLSNKIKSLQL
ncbi:hypothetical protein [Solitalea canadensis]|nr:hypothetical protein [Solitalea canadensis]